MAKKYGDELVGFQWSSKPQGPGSRASRLPVGREMFFSLTPNFSWVRRKTAGGPLNRFNGLLTMPLKLLKQCAAASAGHLTEVRC